MKLQRILFLSAAAATVLLSACSDKNDDTPPTLKGMTYTGPTLDLTYSGSPDPGKTVTVTPKSGNRAELEIYSRLDLSQLTGLGLTGIVDGPGAIPGEDDTDLDITLVPGDGEYTFSGQGATDEVVFKYNGSIRDNHLTLNIVDPELKEKSLAGTVWAPLPLERGEGLTIKTSPVHIDWQMQQIPGISLDPGDALNLLAALPVIPVYNNTAYMSPAELLCQVLKTLAFRADGNVIATYISTSQGAAQFMTLQPNSLQYVTEYGSEMELIMNPASLYGLYLVNQKPVAGFDATAFLQAFVGAAVPGMASGMDMNYIITNSGGKKIMQLYTQTEESVRFIAALAQKLMSNPEILQKVESAIDATPGLAPYKSDILKIASQLPALLKTTTRLNIGLNLVSAS